MKTFFKYMKPYRLCFFLAPLCMVLEVIGELLMPKYLGMLLNQAAGRTPVYSLGMMVLMILTALMMMLFGIGGTYFGIKGAVYFGADLRADVYKKIQSFSFSSLDHFSTGSLVTRLTNDVTQIQNFLSMLLRMFVRAPGMMLGALFMTIRLRPSLSLVLGVSIPLLSLAIFLIVSRGLRRFTRMQGKLDSLNNAVQENVTNMRVVKSFVREDYENGKFAKANDELQFASVSAMHMMVLLSPIMTLCMNLTVAAILWFGGRMVLADTNAMPIGDLSAFIVYCNQILMSLMMITMTIVTGSRALASGRRIQEVLQEKSDIFDSADADPNAKVQRGDIAFEDVSFRYYKNSRENVLDHVSLHIPAGSTVGIIGSTGSGKTTLVSLIARLYDPDEGRILIDGRPLPQYTLSGLRRAIGMVLQKNVLFSGSIEENLRWGDPDASRDELVQAASYAQADSFVSAFPEGYQTQLEQGGVNVSGGQKQRLCIARALLKKPKILILDDSTSAVDTATEAQIRRAFQKELPDTTKIIIAQRISSVQEADEIFVLNEGRITGRGSHRELMESCEEYREIYDSQMENKEVVSHGQNA